MNPPSGQRPGPRKAVTCAKCRLLFGPHQMLYYTTDSSSICEQCFLHPEKDHRDSPDIEPSDATYKGGSSAQIHPCYIQQPTSSPPPTSHEAATQHMAKPSEQPSHSAVGQQGAGSGHVLSHQQQTRQQPSQEQSTTQHSIYRKRTFREGVARKPAAPMHLTKTEQVSSSLHELQSLPDPAKFQEALHDASTSLRKRKTSESPAIESDSDTIRVDNPRAAKKSRTGKVSAVNRQAKKKVESTSKDRQDKH